MRGGFLRFQTQNNDGRFTIGGSRRNRVLCAHENTTLVKNGQVLNVRIDDSSYADSNVAECGDLPDECSVHGRHS